MKVMKDYSFLKITLVLAIIPVISCSVGESPANSLEEAEGILKLAREAIYKDIKSKDIKSIRIEKTSTGITTIANPNSKFTEVPNASTEASGSERKETKIIGDTKIKIQFPDKIKKAILQYSPLPKEVLGEDDKFNSELREYHTLLEQEGYSFNKFSMKMILDGEEAEFDHSESGLFTKPPKIMIGSPFMYEDFRENSFEDTKTDIPIRSRSSEIVRKSLWIDLFPLLLKMPWNSPINWGLPVKFKYVGKARANGKRANVLELASLGKISGEIRGSKAQVKLFFDEESNLLLLITQKSSSGRGTWETKYRFSNYEVIDGLKVAKKINIESIFPIENRSEKILTETTIKKLEINPTFSSKDFELN